MMSLDTYWPEILDVVRQRVAQQTFNTWFLPLLPENSDCGPRNGPSNNSKNDPQNDSTNGSMKVACPNHFFMDWFSEHHLTSLNEAGSTYFGRDINFTLGVRKNSSVGLSVDSSAESPAGLVSKSSENRSGAAAAVPNALNVPRSRLQAVTSLRPSTLSNINRDYTFDNFVVGTGTDLVFAAATAVSNNPGGHFNPLFIHGGVGLGKTHLMHAVGNAVAKKNPDKKICYVTAENFMNDLIGSIRDNRTPEFKMKYRSMDVLLVDDVAFLAGKESTQEEFFHTFNALYDLKKQIVLTSDRSPKEITTLEERLRSRFEWGLITDIQPPNLETRMAILKRKVEINNIYISDDVITYIAENITDNIRRLEGALIRLLAFASLTGREISLEMASEVLSSFFQGSSTGPVKIADIMKIVGEVHDVTVDQFKSKRRTQDLARARQIAMYLAREMTGASLNQIGRAFGNRDHSTVSHAYHKIQKDMKNDPRFRGAVLDVQDRVRGRN